MSVPNVGPTNYRDGGNRGGRDQFKWEDVKADAQRGNYLGNSLMAPVGRLGERRSVDWWNKSKTAEAKDLIAREKSDIKEKERLAMEKALGISIPPAERKMKSDKKKKSKSKSKKKRKRSHSPEKKSNKRKSM